MATNKNTMLPTFEATYENMLKGLESGGLITSPCWVYVTDRECLAFVHYEKVNGEKKLVPHVMLWDSLNNIKSDVAEVKTNVTSVTESVQEIQQNGAAVMITSDGGDL